MIVPRLKLEKIHQNTLGSIGNMTQMAENTAPLEL